MKQEFWTPAGLSKQEALLALAHKRQQQIPAGYRGIGDYHSGAYECDYVSPYTKSAHNLDADIMFILQDWSSDAFLRLPINEQVVELGYTPELPTNKNLIALLNAHFGVSLSDTFGTNLFPFIKPGNLSATIPARELKHAALEYAIPQIMLISPKLVICFGVSVYNAIRRGLGVSPVRRLADAIESPMTISGIRVWAQSHPGGLGRAGRNRGGVDRVTRDWSLMARSLNP